MVEQFNFKTHGTCSRNILISVENGLIQNIEFEGGCPGNLAGISLLVKNRELTEIADLLRGVKCGGKQTSCPDQLAQALTEIVKTRNSH